MDPLQQALLVLVVVTLGGGIVYAVVRTLQEGARDKLRSGEAIADRDAIYAALFDGRDVVTYEASRGAIPADMVIADAAARGYTLTNRAVQGRVHHLVFTRRDLGSPSPEPGPATSG